MAGYQSIFGPDGPRGSNNPILQRQLGGKTNPFAGDFQPGFWARINAAGMAKSQISSTPIDPGTIHDPVTLHNALKAGHISVDQFQQRLFEIQSPKGAKGPVYSKKNIVEGIAGGVAKTAGEVSGEVLRATPRAAAELMASAQPTNNAEETHQNAGPGMTTKSLGPAPIVKKTAPTPNVIAPKGRVGKLLLGNEPVTSIQAQAKGAKDTHPGGFHIKGTPITLTPKETQVAEGLGKLGLDIATVYGAAKGAELKVNKFVAKNEAARTLVKSQAGQTLLAKARDANAKAYGEDLIKSKTAAPETKMLPAPSGKVSGEGFVMKPTADPVRAAASKRLVTINRQLDAVAQGKKSMAPADLKALKAEKQALYRQIPEETKAAPTPSVGPNLKTTVKETPESKATKFAGNNEAGFAAPGQAAKDIKDYMNKSKVADNFSGEVAKDNNMHTNGVKQRMVDTGDLLKKVGKAYTKEDKLAVYHYRERAASGANPGTLTPKQQELHDLVTEITKQTNQNKLELARRKAPGYSFDKIFDPSVGNHRIAVGKGSALERFLHGGQTAPVGGKSLRTTSSSSKAATYYTLVDEKGNRSVAAIKNVSVQQGMKKVPKGKYVDQVLSKGNSVRLGKITPAQLKKGEFTTKDGRVFKVMRGNSEEITKATGQEYFKDPLTNALIDYHETSNALSSARMLDKWKTSPEFEKIAMKVGEGTPPKGWTTTRLPQLQGYYFDKKVAETLDDIYGRMSDTPGVINATNHALRSAMVAIPIRHNLNELGFYFTDRGLSGVVNPFKLYKGSQNLVKAVNAVMTQNADYRRAMASGFNFMYRDDKAFADQVNKTMRSMLDDPKMSQQLASDLGMPVRSLHQAWNSIQHNGVWFQQDVLNMARIYDRAGKSMNIEKAAAETARFNPQYRVPSRVAGSRGLSKLLRNNNILFFGSYHYDQWKSFANVLADLRGKSGAKGAIEAVDKMAAATLAIWATHALIDKGIQAVTGNHNAYTKAFGNLDLPDQLYDVIKGSKTPSQLVQSQLFPSVSLNVMAQLFENRDFFTGKQIYDPNMPRSEWVKEVGSWLNAQMPTTQQVQNVKKGGTLTAGALSLAGARFPKNAPETNVLESLRYDTLPTIQSAAKKQAQAGDTAGAQKTISQYDTLVLAAAKKALKAAGKPIPSDDELIKSLKKEQYYYQPKDSTIQKWSTEKPSSILNRL